MPATVIVGAQWGDEGKGKIVDLLAQESDLVCRYQGGPNAGHTVIVDGETFKFRQMPSGIVSGQAERARQRLRGRPGGAARRAGRPRERAGTRPSSLRVSGNAHLIMPWHIALDGASERRLGQLQIGTTRRGIGPAYADKATRIGIRVQDLLDPKILRQKIEPALAEKNVWLERVYGLEPFELERRAPSGTRATPSGCGRTSPTRRCSSRGARDGQARAVRGRAGHAARPRPRHVSVRHLVEPDRRRAPRPASASARHRIDEVVGVAKAYVTRVGAGPFPSEMDERARRRRCASSASEFGTVTGRERRCGWLDLVALRFAVRVNGITSLALTKLDVLSAFDELPRLRPLPAPGRHARPTTSRPTRATSTTPSRCSRRCPAGARSSTTAAPPPTCRRRPRLRRVRRASARACRSTLVGDGRGARRDPRRELDAVARAPRGLRHALVDAPIASVPTRATAVQQRSRSRSSTQRRSRAGRAVDSAVKVLLVGSGGREHALAWKLAQAPR